MTPPQQSRTNRPPNTPTIAIDSDPGRWISRARSQQQRRNRAAAAAAAAQNEGRMHTAGCCSQVHNVSRAAPPCTTKGWYPLPFLAYCVCTAAGLGASTAASTHKHRHPCTCPRINQCTHGPRSGGSTPLHAAVAAPAAAAGPRARRSTHTPSAAACSHAAAHTSGRIA